MKNDLNDTVNYIGTQIIDKLLQLKSFIQENSSRSTLCFQSR